MRPERRSLLKSALASAAISAPAMLPGCFLSQSAAAIRKAAPYVPASGDDELVALGPEFDRAYAEWLPTWHEWQRIEKAWRVEIERQNLSFREHGDDRLFAIFSAMGGDEAVEANEAAVAKLDAIADAIGKVRATTIAGLAVKAKVARFNGISIHDVIAPSRAEVDADAEALLNFFDEIEEMARASA